MTEQHLRELIAQGESLMVEFKGEESRPLSDDEIVEAIVCLANRPEGDLGWLLLGVKESQARRPLGLDALLILNRLWQERRLTTQKAACLTQKPETETRAVLERLVEYGLVETRRKRKGRVCRLSATACRRLERPVAYVRQQGFELIQQEQMILQYVEEYRRITRREAAELCRISPEQAYYLLQRFVRQDKLTQKGTKKGSIYELYA